MLGLAGRDRVYRWIRSEYVTGPENFNKYKVVVPEGAVGSGVGKEPAWSYVEPLLVVEPQVAVTQTFITIGCFGDRRPRLTLA